MRAVRLLALSIIGLAVLLHASNSAGAQSEPDVADVDFEPRYDAATLPPLERSQRLRLYLFATQVFRDPLPGLRHRSGTVERRHLLERFGQPSRVEEAEFPSRDPGEPPHIETTFQFDGIRIVTHSPRDAGQAPSDLLRIRRIDVTTPAIALKYGLNVGQPLERFLALFGEVLHTAWLPQKALYLDEARYRCELGGVCALEYELALHLDAQRRVHTVSVAFPEH